MSSRAQVWEPTLIDALSLHKISLVVSAHHDILVDVLTRRLRGEKELFKNRWIPNLRKGGVKVQVFPVFIDTEYLPELALRKTMQMIDALYSEIEENTDAIVLATSYSDIEKALEEGKIAGLLALEGGEALGNELSALRLLYKLGVRSVSLTWNRRTSLADGLGEIRTKGGLTTFGVEVIGEMERLNMIIDVSHISEPGFWDIMAVSRKTVIASHSDSRAVYDHPRNLSDEQIKAIAERKGVIGILTHPGVIDPKNPTISRVIDHIEYISNLVGIDYVGLGPDFVTDVMPQYALPTPSEISEWLFPPQLTHEIKDLETVTQLPNLTAKLVERGFSEQEVKKVLGENFLRVFRLLLK